MRARRTPTAPRVGRIVIEQVADGDVGVEHATPVAEVRVGDEPSRRHRRIAWVGVFALGMLAGVVPGLSGPPPQRVAAPALTASPAPVVAPAAPVIDYAGEAIARFGRGAAGGACSV